MLTVRRLMLGLVVILLAGSAGFVVWASDSLEPMPEAIAALQTDASVEVQTQSWLVFKPVTQSPTTGLILYPGGKVDARAYAPLAHAIAARGYLAVIVPMPLNLAFFGADQAAQVIRAYPSIRHWAIGGHSLGGVAAASFAKSHADHIDGIVFLASYPADYDNLSACRFAVTSISGTLDALSTPRKIDQSRALLPPETHYVTIEGGNHGQMGWYGVQPGDNAAAISREEQQAQVVAATVMLLEQIGGQVLPPVGVSD